MNVFSNLLKVLIILVLIVFVGSFLVLGAMVLFPGFTLFGVHYVSGDRQVSHYFYDTVNDTYYSKEPKQDATEPQTGKWSQVSDIEIVTDGWDITLRSAYKNETVVIEKGFNVYMNRFFRGFATNDVKEPTFSNFTFEERADGMYLVMKMTEPTGILSRQNTSLVVVVNEGLLANKKVHLVTNSGTIRIGNAVKEDSITTEFTDIDISSKSSAVYLNDVTINNELNVSKDSGDFYANKDLTCNSVIKISKGLGKVYVNNIGSESSAKTISLEDMNNVDFRFETIYGDFYYRGNAGYIKGKNIKKSFALDANYCDIAIEQIEGAMLYNNKDGSLAVDTVKNGITADVTNGRGAVHIKNLYGASAIRTNSGNITVDNVFNDIIVGSQSGNIKLNNADDKTVNFKIITTNSNVEITNVNGSVNMTTENKGKAICKVSYKKLIGTNKIVTHTGSAYVKFLYAGHSFLLKEWKTVNSIYIKLSNLTEESVNDSKANETYKNGYKIGGYDGTDDNLSVLSESGQIKIYQELTV